MFELVLLVPQDGIDAVSDTLMDALGALAVSVEDADAAGPGEQALFGEPGLPPPASGWQRSLLKALFQAETDATAAATWLLANRDVRLRSVDAVPDEDWVRLTQAQFTPVEITPRFWIVPSWHEPPAGATQVIRLDPGLAFGTGTHPTTRMCLRWLAREAEARPAPWPDALDYGCGSGILAIAAALLGVPRVLAIDIDPAAVAATRANAQANGVRLTSGLPDQVSGRHALVLANILAKPLELLAPLLCGRLAPGADLVLAGILERQADELISAYAPWVSLSVADRDEGWVLMTARMA